jgi:hypothetical protein
VSHLGGLLHIGVILWLVLPESVQATRCSGWRRRPWGSHSSVIDPNARFARTQVESGTAGSRVVCRIRPRVGTRLSIIQRSLRWSDLERRSRYTTLVVTGSRGRAHGRPRQFYRHGVAWKRHGDGAGSRELSPQVYGVLIYESSAVIRSESPGMISMTIEYACISRILNLISHNRNPTKSMISSFLPTWRTRSFPLFGSGACLRVAPPPPFPAGARDASDYSWPNENN